MKTAINHFYLSLVTLLICITFSNAQNNDFKLFDNNPQNVSRKSLSTNDRTLLQELVYNKMATAYFMDNKVDMPIKLSTERIVTDVTSFPLLNREKSKTVQVVVVKILNNTELRKTIDFSVFKNFPNLKCVYISCEIRANQQQILQMIKKDKNSQVPMTFMGINIPQ